MSLTSISPECTCGAITSCVVVGGYFMHAYLLNLDFALINDLLQYGQLVDRDQFLLVVAQSSM